MRDIKFRAWDINKKKYIPNECWAVVSTDFGAFGIMIKDWKNYREGEYFYSDSQILMQYTGLKDKHGTEIYEGDIVIFGKHIKYKVIFEDGCFYLYHHEGLKEWDGKDYRWGPLYRVKELQFDTEIISNIYEH